MKENEKNMDISERKSYGGDADCDNGGACQNCGCRHREEIGRFDDGRTVRVTQVCRYCGRQFVTTY